MSFYKFIALVVDYNKITCRPGRPNSDEITMMITYVILNMINRHRVGHFLSFLSVSQRQCCRGAEERQGAGKCTFISHPLDFPRKKRPDCRVRLQRKLEKLLSNVFSDWQNKVINTHKFYKVPLKSKYFFGQSKKYEVNSSHSSFCADST